MYIYILYTYITVSNIDISNIGYISSKKYDTSSIKHLERPEWMIAGVHVWKDEEKPATSWSGNHFWMFLVDGVSFQWFFYPYLLVTNTSGTTKSGTTWYGHQCTKVHVLLARSTWCCSSTPHQQHSWPLAHGKTQGSPSLHEVLHLQDKIYTLW